MTVTDSRRKPAPSPRTEPRPAVTERRSEICNAEPQPAPVERETRDSGRALLQSAITVGSRVAEGVRRYWTLPPVFADQPPTIDQIKAYARRAAYTDKTGIRRACGVAWCYMAAIPNTAAARVWSALWERPGRIALVLAVVKLLSFTQPVTWVVNNVLAPGADLALWLFL